MSSSRITTLVRKNNKKKKVFKMVKKNVNIKIYSVKAGLSAEGMVSSYHMLEVSRIRQ